jgi:hypothetical protein
LGAAWVPGLFQEPKGFIRKLGDQTICHLRPAGFEGSKDLEQHAGELGLARVACLLDRPQQAGFSTPVHVPGVDSMALAT